MKLTWEAVYEVVTCGHPAVLLSLDELRRLPTQRGKYDGALLTTGSVWFWRAWRTFHLVRGTAHKTA